MPVEIGKLLQFAMNAPAQAEYDMIKAIVSIVLITLVLIWLSAIYRGGAGDDEIEKPVALLLTSAIDAKGIIFAPGHFAERTTHNSKAPRIDFYLQVPGEQKYKYRALTQPLKIAIRDRNGSLIFDHTWAALRPNAPGGQIGINADTREALEEYFKTLFKREGRRFNADTATFVLKLKYPMSVNLDYLLREHPDTSVRVGAWIFLLTSLFSVFQELIMRGISSAFFPGVQT